MRAEDPSTLKLFAVCPPGLEPLLAEEWRGLGVRGITPVAGGIAAVGDLETMYRVNLASGVASHVLLRVAEFGVRSLADLDHRGSRIDWRQYLPAGTATKVKARCRHSRIYHSGAAEERIARHLEAQLAPSPPPDAPTEQQPSGEGSGDEGTIEPVPVRVRIDDNRCTISLDTSGTPLHRRGWRIDPGPAPLREDLARALLIAAGFEPGMAVLDPMMGSGTILIEAAGLARRLAPGRLRRFAMERFAIHEADLFESVKRRLATQELPGVEAPIFGSDRAAGASERVRQNAERAGVLGDVSLREASLSESLDTIFDGTREGVAGLPERGVLVSNPPHGKRLDNPASLVRLYRAIGELARQLPPKWRVALAVADRRLALRSGLPLESAFLVESGGIKIRAMTTTPGR